MKRMKKLALTTVALAALAVGGAAFANAQDSVVATQVATQQSAADLPTPGDTPDTAGADVQGSGDQSDTADASDRADAPDSAAEQANDGPESAAENDGPGKRHDESNGTDADQETQND